MFGYRREKVQNLKHLQIHFFIIGFQTYVLCCIIFRQQFRYKLPIILSILFNFLIALVFSGIDILLLSCCNRENINTKNEEEMTAGIAVTDI